MTELKAENLLNLWDYGASLSPLRRCLHLLATAWPEKSHQQWAESRMGERDGALLSLREALFGQTLEAVAHCPACGEPLEMRFTTAQIRAGNDLACPEGRVELNGYEVSYRLPTSLDLLAATEEAMGMCTETALLRRCVLSARYAEHPVDAGQLPAELIQAIEEGMARLDPQAETMIDLNCPQCRHSWQTSFDIAAYLWDEISDWAVRTLRDVHTLARAYGWREHDILAMSARRRRCYLELLGA